MPNTKTADTKPQLPERAQVVIVGGGVIGCSIAYHLAKRGWKDVLLLEQGTLSCGTTWHAAGLIGQLRSSHTLTELTRYGSELYARLEEETGQATGWKQCGSVNMASTPARWTELLRTASMAQGFGIDVEILTPEQVGERVPILRTDDLHGGLWMPNDGKVNPADVTQALARGARSGGVTIRQGVKATGFRIENGAVVGVETDCGFVEAEKVVNAGGQWARGLGLLAGVAVPLHAAEHRYIITKRLEGVSPDMPVLRDYDYYIYVKEEVGGLLLGGFEPVAVPWGMEGIPDKFENQVLPWDWDNFEILMDGGLHRLPCLETAEVPRELNGPESFTPDGNYIMGEAPGVRNYYVAAGFNSSGIAGAGGAGMALADWIVDGEPHLDLWEVDIRRFNELHNDPVFLRDRVIETLGMHYKMHWPHLELESGRGLLKSPLYDRLEKGGACFGAVFGWERANWFARKGEKPVMEYCFGKQNWFDASAEEHVNTRQKVTVFDQTSFGKLRVEGPDAMQVMQRLCANEMDVESGRVIYTAMLNGRGCFESDLTVTRLSETVYMVVTGAAQPVRDMDRIRRHIGDDRATVTDVSGETGVLGVMGPASRELLSALTTDDLGNESFGFMSSQKISLAGATVQASRLTYVGELGWELYVPIDSLAAVYDAIMQEGRGHGLRNGGYYAINSLRMEKGYRHWGHDLTPDDTALEAGLGFAVRLGKQVPFIGRDALLRQRDEGFDRLLVMLALDDPQAIAHGEEPIFRDGEVVGYVTTAAYGHTVGHDLVMGYVRGGKKRPLKEMKEWLSAGRYEVEIAGERIAATLHLTPPYDPKSLRVRDVAS